MSEEYDYSQYGGLRRGQEELETELKEINKELKKIMKVQEKYENRKKQVIRAINLYKYYYDQSTGWLESHHEPICDRLNEIDAEKREYEKEKNKEESSNSNEGDEDDTD